MLATKRVAMEDLAIVSDAPKLHAAYEEMKQAQEAVDALYARWSELERKMS